MAKNNEKKGLTIGKILGIGLGACVSLTVACICGPAVAAETGGKQLLAEIGAIGLGLVAANAARKFVEETGEDLSDIWNEQYEKAIEEAKKAKAAKLANA